MNSPVLELETSLLAVNRIEAKKIVKESCTQESAVHCIETLIVPALDHIGKGWENGTVALSQVYMSGRLCEDMVDLMLPAGDNRRVIQPKIAIAALLDHHNLGKRIVYSIIRAGGYDVIDYGHGISVDNLVNAVIRDNIDILLISTLMLPAALKVKEATSRIKKERPTTKVIVGGAPFNFDPALYRDVGADAMAHTASDTLEIVKQMAGGMT
jgi:methanogenic corrinoid protein MtbC1